MSTSDSSTFSTPTMLSGPKASPIIVFGSQGSDFLHAFDAIFVLARYQPQLQSFISFALDAIRMELQSVANAPIGQEHGPEHPRNKEIELLPHLPPFHVFSDLRSLVSHHAETNRTDPVINGVLLCLLHAANIVAVHCARGNLHTPALAESWTAISHPHAHLLGLCTGVISGWAAGTIIESCEVEQSNIWRFMHAAINSIRLSFWIGLRSKASRKRLARESHTFGKAEDRWSLVISTNADDPLNRVQNLLNDFQNSSIKKHPEFSSQLCVTAHALEQISVSGPPALLQIFSRWLQDITNNSTLLRTCELEIYSPYHTPDLQDEVEHVMQHLEKRLSLQSADLPPQTKTVWDAAKFGGLCETDPFAYVRRLVESNLCRPAWWDATVENLLKSEEQQEGVCSRSRVIVSLGPGLSLAADIKKRFLAHCDTQDSSSILVYDLPCRLRAWAKFLESTSEGIVPRKLTDPHVEGDEVVIVSMACRFPGDVQTPEQLWTCLESGRQTVSEVPEHLFNIDHYYGSGMNQTLARHMHALPKGVTQTMDARLFSMSPKEVEQLDPQHRLTMLCSYEALEKAGYSHDANSPSSFDRKRIAICMGASWDDYRENASHNIGSYFITGNIRAFIPGHVSFSLRWEGPSVSVDTLECTAVSAIEWSRRALLSHQCDVALAGAVNVLTQPQIFVAMDKDGVLSRSGTNATFSTLLNGKTRGDGCGVLLLKRRSTALRDGDTILASIPAATTASHHLAGDQCLLASSQANVLSKLFTKKGPGIDSITHIEASGHHSQQAEAVEFESFGQVLASTKDPLSKVSVSSTRPNIGAGEAVSAMASVMKAVLMLQKGIVPRHMGFTEASQLQPRIADVCKSTMLFVPTEAHMMPKSDAKRCILVNSLASTGHQGAVLIQEADVVALPKIGRDARTSFIFALSARTIESVEGQRKALLNYLFREVNLRDLSYTLMCRRTHHQFRIAVVAGSQEDLIQALRTAEINEMTFATDLPEVGFFYERESSKMNARHAEDFVASDESLRERRNVLRGRLLSMPDLTEEEQFTARQVLLSTLLLDLGLKPKKLSGSLAPAMYLHANGAIDANVVASFIENRSTLIGDEAQLSTLKAARGVQETVCTSAALPEIREEAGQALWISVGDSVNLIDRSTNQAQHTSALLYKELLATLADLHQRGYDIKWIELHRPYLYDVKMLHDVPTYSYHLQRHWMEYHDRCLIAMHQTAETNTAESSIKSEASDEDSTDDTEDEGGISLQPLLSLRVKATPDEIVYRCDSEGEPHQVLLDLIGFCSPLSVFAEILGESAFEAVSSHSNTEIVCLRNLQLHDLSVGLSKIGRLYTKIRPMCGRGAVSRERDGPELASCAYELVPRLHATRAWATTQSLLKDRLTKIVEEGEMLGSRLVQRALAKVCKRKISHQAIHSVSVLSSESVALLTCRVSMPKSCSGLAFQQVPHLMDALDQCGLWFCGNIVALRDISFEMCAVQKSILIPNQQKATGDFSDFQVYISLLEKHVEATHDDKSITIEMLVLDSDLNITGELRAAKYQLTAKNADIKDTSGTATKLAPSMPAVPPSNNAGLTSSAPSGPPAAMGAVSAKKSKSVTVFEKILDVLASELGISVEEIRPTIKFADLGLDSLMSLVCLSTLESLHFDFSIPQSLFLECDSPGELLTWIRTQVGDDPVSAQSIVIDEAVPHQSVTISNAESVAGLNRSHDGDNKADKAMTLIVQTIEIELGVEAGSIRYDANLADLGMDSLMSLLVLGSLKTQLSFELPPSLFLECPTLRDIHAFIVNKLPRTEISDTPNIAPVSIPSLEQKRSFTVPTPKAPVLLHSGPKDAAHDQTPLFLLPDGSGMSLVYQLLPSIDRPVYGINSAFLGNAAEWDGGVEHIAQYYYACMQLVQPRGPYLIGGWSFGGIAAFEIARMLGSDSYKTDRVAGLFLLHSPCPTKYPPLPMSFVDYITDTDEVRDIAPRSMSTKLIAHFKATVDNLALYSARTAEAEVYAVYVVPSDPLPGSATGIKEANATIEWLFQEHDDVCSPDGWETLLPTLRTVPLKNANHFTIVRPPAINQVASILAHHCRAALAFRP